ncbi:unnamed protein product [Alopecurus aequalis]
MDADGASQSESAGHAQHRTVWSEPPKRPAGRSKFNETRHAVYRGVRRRGPAGGERWVCEVRVHGSKGCRLWLGTFTSADMAARAHDAAALALSGQAACLNFADSAWLMRPVLAAGGSSSAQAIKDAVAVAIKAFQQQQQRQAASPERAGSGSSASSELLDEHWFGGMDYYEDDDMSLGMMPTESPEDGQRFFPDPYSSVHY